MKKIAAFFILIMILLSISSEKINPDYLSKYYEKSPIIAVEQEEFYQTNFTKSYRSKVSEPALEDLQCPIPKSDRVKNYTGIQCVYSSIEMLGRWCEEEKLINPPITSRPDCKGYSSPNAASKILNKLGVKFEQTYGDKKRGIELLKKAMKEGRGALWSVPGHAMVIVHYDESQNMVCWVDNSDSKLRIQKTTIEKFNQRWTSWILVIYPDDDYVLNNKLNKFNIPIIDRRTNEKLPINFLPFPISY
jgi:hypothetical protein